ncbi:MAG: hypothetical protein KDA85_08490 [Planctomycetaceae bacterium]|nr:hypothetical protein [Planctomycetaceae bacterium]
MRGISVLITMPQGTAIVMRNGAAALSCNAVVHWMATVVIPVAQFDLPKVAHAATDRIVDRQM